MKAITTVFNRIYQIGTILLLGVVFCTGQTGQAQNRITIQNAKEIIGFTVDGERVRKLLGDVHLQSDAISMFADSAYQYLETSEIEAFGNIELQTEDEIIWTDSLLYNMNTDKVYLNGRIIIELNSTTIYSRSVIHNLNTKISTFLDMVRLEDGQEILTANRGTYFQRKDSAVFRGNVQVQDSLQYVEGDSLFTNRQNRTYEIYDHIFARDSIDNVILTTDYLSSDTLNNKYLKGNSHIVKIDTTNNDTTHIWAKNITYFDQDSTYSIRAVTQVVAWTPQFSAIADTLWYDNNIEMFELFGTPKTWHNNMQLSGPYIRATLQNQQMESLSSYPRPFVTQKDTNLNRLNQITGDSLFIDFDQGTLKTVFVKNNASLVRFMPKEDSVQIANGVVQINTPTRIKLTFSAGEIDKMKSGKNSTGRYIPETPNIKNLKLQGFIWTPDLRPQRPVGLPVRKLPPIPTTPLFELPMRYIEYLEKQTPE